jgi:hypothetical protein
LLSISGVVVTSCLITIAEAAKGGGGIGGGIGGGDGLGEGGGEGGGGEGGGLGGGEGGGGEGGCEGGGSEGGGEAGGHGCDSIVTSARRVGAPVCHGSRMHSTYGSPSAGR